MATTRTFSAMLNDYIKDDLLMGELKKRDFWLSNVEIDNGWKGGTAKVPFRGAQASSVKFGGLTASNDIAESKYVVGKIDEYKEVWGSLIFNEADLQQHDGRIPESTFLKILPNEIDNFMRNFKEVVSYQLGGGPHFAVVVDDANAASGVMQVDKIDRFIIGQKLTLDDDDSPTISVYVTGIDVNANTVTLSATRGGAPLSLTAYTEAGNAKFYYDGAWDGTNLNTFTSIRSVLLSQANGGSSTVHGVNKLLYPYLQGLNISGAGITGINLLEKLFDANVQIAQKARGKADTIVMSLKHWGSIMKIQQQSKGGFKTVSDPKRSEFGWWETSIAEVSTGRALKIAAVQEMNDSEIYFLDFSGIVFMTNGGFKKRKGPDGRMYYEVRNTTGYQYIVDTCLFGEMKFLAPGDNAVIYGIPNY